MRCATCRTGPDPRGCVRHTPGVRATLLIVLVALAGCAGDAVTSASTTTVATPLAEYDAYWTGLDSDQQEFQCQVFLFEGVEAPGAAQLYEGTKNAGAIPPALTFDEWSAYLTEQCAA